MASSGSMKNTRAIESAVEHLKRADVLLINTGAGMGVDSGLGTFRGTNAGVWPPMKELGIDYQELTDPIWFDSHPWLAWTYWLACYNTFKEKKPHKGYDIINSWISDENKKQGIRNWKEIKGDCSNNCSNTGDTGGKRRVRRVIPSAYCFTSNIDDHWSASGLAADKITECHGNVNRLQCIHGKRCPGRAMWLEERKKFLADHNDKPYSSTWEAHDDMEGLELEIRVLNTMLTGRDHALCNLLPPDGGTVDPKEAPIQYDGGKPVYKVSHLDKRRMRLENNPEQNGTKAEVYWDIARPPSDDFPPKKFEIWNKGSNRKLPLCPWCKSLARPNVLCFFDGDWIKREDVPQDKNRKNFEKTNELDNQKNALAGLQNLGLLNMNGAASKTEADDSSNDPMGRSRLSRSGMGDSKDTVVESDNGRPYIVILEIGAGTAVPSVRGHTETCAGRYAAKAAIRINLSEEHAKFDEPDECSTYMNMARDEGIDLVSISGLSAREALTMIDEKLQF